MTKSFDAWLDEKLKDPEFRREYEARENRCWQALQRIIARLDRETNEADLTGEADDGML
jgi:hypothetical protein